MVATIFPQTLVVLNLIQLFFEQLSSLNYNGFRLRTPAEPHVGLSCTSKFCRLSAQTIFGYSRDQSKSRERPSYRKVVAQFYKSSDLLTNIN